MQVDADLPAGSLQNLIDSPSLRWIFVGGKGGVGKTTTSCSLAAALSEHRSSVLLISTDPAHNLSDAFGQRFNKQATLVSGFSNLYAMEIDPAVEVEAGELLSDASSALVSELVSSIPGIDEAMSFAELMRQVTRMQYAAVVFDTAPTGHTLRLLSFPSLLDKALSRLLSLRSRFAPLLSQLSAAAGVALPSEDGIAARLLSTKQTIDSVLQQFRDPALTTFVCVCIPEFLSLYETERLVQELARQEMDVCNVVVNQVSVMPAGSHCRKCAARGRMQSKYLQQIAELYEELHVTLIPLMEDEVRGVDSIRQFAHWLLHPDEARKAAERGDEGEEKQ